MSFPFMSVISPGILSTVQDLGRNGFAHLGISPAGAADAVSIRMGNLLAGNPETAPALEMTITGPELGFLEKSVVALTGADMRPTIDGSAVPMWTTLQIKPGQILKCHSAASGCRSYLCVRGGIEVPLVFGSASTHLQSRLGGFEGRQLKRGDQLLSRAAAGVEFFQPLQLTPDALSRLEPRKHLRVTSGPQSDMFAREAHATIYSVPYKVTPQSDRMGLRLDGPPLARVRGATDILTEGVSLGAVQITHAGNPIILFVDHQTTGGYPKIANIISADMHSLGQLSIGEEVRFELVSLAEASKALIELESILHQHPFVRV